MEWFHDIEEIGSCGRPTDADLEDFAAVGTLKSIHVQGRAISDKTLASLVHCKFLYWLRLELTSITDTGVDALEQMHELQDLEITNSQISDAGLMRLAELPNLKFLRVRSDRITLARQKAWCAAHPRVHF